MNIPSTRNTQSTPSSSFQMWKTQSLDTSPRSGKCNRTCGRASGSALAFMLKTDRRAAISNLRSASNRPGASPRISVVQFSMTFYFGIVVYRLVSRVNGVLEHANIRLWRPLDRAGSLIWCTPDMHKVHHSNEQVETDTNYGNIFSIFLRAEESHFPKSPGVCCTSLFRLLLVDR